MLIFFLQNAGFRQQKPTKPLRKNMYQQRKQKPIACMRYYILFFMCCIFCVHICQYLEHDHQRTCEFEALVVAQRESRAQFVITKLDLVVFIG